MTANAPWKNEHPTWKIRWFLIRLDFCKVGYLTEGITLEKIDDHYSSLQMKWSATERIEEWKNGNEEWKQTIASCFVNTIHYPYKTLMPKVVPLKVRKKVTAARKDIKARLVLRKSKYSESKSSKRVALWVK